MDVPSMVVVTPRSSKRTNVIHARAIEGSVRNYSKQKTIADVHFHYPNKCLSDRTQTATAAAEVSSQKNRKPSRIIETRLDKSTQKSAKVITLTYVLHTYYVDLHSTYVYLNITKIK